MRVETDQAEGVGSVASPLSILRNVGLNFSGDCKIEWLSLKDRATKKLILMVVQ